MSKKFINQLKFMLKKVFTLEKNLFYLRPYLPKLHGRIKRMNLMMRQDMKRQSRKSKEVVFPRTSFIKIPTLQCCEKFNRKCKRFIPEVMANGPLDMVEYA